MDAVLTHGMATALGMMANVMSSELTVERWVVTWYFSPIVSESFKGHSNIAYSGAILITNGPLVNVPMVPLFRDSLVHHGGNLQSLSRGPVSLGLFLHASLPQKMASAPRKLMICWWLHVRFRKYPYDWNRQTAACCRSMVTFRFSSVNTWLAVFTTSASGMFSVIHPYTKIDPDKRFGVYESYGEAKTSDLYRSSLSIQDRIIMHRFWRNLVTWIYVIHKAAWISSKFSGAKTDEQLKSPLFSETQAGINSQHGNWLTEHDQLMNTGETTMMANTWPANLALVCHQPTKRHIHWAADVRISHAMLYSYSAARRFVWDKISMNILSTTI